MTELAKFEVSARPCASVETHQCRALLRVTGEVDIATSPQLERELEKLLSAGQLDVVIDMAAVDFIDASGISVLIAAVNRALEAGGGILLRRPSKRVLRVLEILQLDESLPIIQDPA